MVGLEPAGQSGLGCRRAAEPETAEAEATWSRQRRREAQTMRHGRNLSVATRQGLGWPAGPDGEAKPAWGRTGAGRGRVDSEPARAGRRGSQLAGSPQAGAGRVGRTGASGHGRSRWRTPEAGAAPLQGKWRRRRAGKN